MNGRRSQRSPVLALDLGAHSLKVLALKRDGQAQMLETASVALESQDAVSNAQAVRETLSRLGVGTGPGLVVSSSIGGAECVAQVVDLPPLEDNEVAQAAQFEGKKICPVAGEPLAVGHQILGRLESPARVRILVAAVPESLYRRHLRSLDEAGLTPYYVEPAVLALANAAASQQEQTGGLLLDIGHHASHLIVLLEGGQFFARRIEPGGQDFTGALMQHFGIAASHAEELKHRVGLRPARPGDPKETAEAAATMAPIADQLVFELRRSLTFAETLPGFPHGFSSLTLSGGGALLEGLAPALGRILGVDIKLLDPLGGRKINWRGVDPESPERVKYAHAMGLMERWL